MEYIKVTDALRCLSDALDNRKEYLGNFLDQYGLFNLTVYVSKDDGKSLEKDAVETKLLHDWIRTRYPVQSLMQTKFVSPYHSPKVQQAIINAMHSDEFSTEYQHYWEKDKFYSNRIFDLINNKPEIVGYQFGMNTDEITASTIQNLNDQLKNQADEIATLQARIKELETATPADKLLEEEDPRTINNLLRLLLAINEMAKAKNGKYVDFFSQDLKNNLEKISTQLDLLGYKHIGDEAYKTIRTMIRERNDKL